MNAPIRTPLTLDQKWEKRFLRERGRTVPLSKHEIRIVARRHVGPCDICGTTKPGGHGSKNGRFHVDHCYKSLRIRGVLCANCNQGLGKFKDDPKMLDLAISYLAT